MKQTLLIETNGLVREGLMGLLRSGELNFLRLSNFLDLGGNHYAFYFNRLSFDEKSTARLRKLKTQLKLLGGFDKFEFHNY